MNIILTIREETGEIYWTRCVKDDGSERSLRELSDAAIVGVADWWAEYAAYRKNRNEKLGFTHDITANPVTKELQ